MAHAPSAPRTIRRKIFNAAVGAAFNGVWILLPVLPAGAVLLSWLHGL